MKTLNLTTAKKVNLNIVKDVNLTIIKTVKTIKAMKTFKKVIQIIKKTLEEWGKGAGHALRN